MYKTVTGVCTFGIKS